MNHVSVMLIVEVIRGLNISVERAENLVLCIAVRKVPTTSILIHWIAANRLLMLSNNEALFTLRECGLFVAKLHCFTSQSGLMYF